MVVVFTVIYQYPNLLEGADSVGRQLRGDKECNEGSGITNSDRVWRNMVPESDARSVLPPVSGNILSEPLNLFVTKLGMVVHGRGLE